MQETTTIEKREKRTKRRGNGEGSIFQRDNGRWVGQIAVGYNANGKRLRRIVYGDTKREVQEAMTRLQNRKLNGTLGEESRLTVAEFMARWLEDSVRAKAAGTTFDRYTGIVKRQINPKIGGVKLAKITPAHVQGLLSSMEADGFKPASLLYAYSVLRRAMNVALRWGFIARNPTSVVDPPKPKYREITPLNAEQARALLKASESHRLHALFVLALQTGMRQGELFGLHWQDVDLERGTLTVRHTLEEIKGVLRLKEPKSKAGRRNIKLPKTSVAALWQHKAKMLAEGYAAVPWVFCDTDGKPLRKSNVERRVWKPIRAAAKLADGKPIPQIRFHDLRHTAATLLLLEGVHPKVVQERLGHAKISITLDTYSHVLPGMQDEAADKLNRLFA